MTDIAKLLEAIGAVAWPAIVILLILLFRPAIAGLIESAKSRKFTLRLGGQELTIRGEGLIPIPNQALPLLASEVIEILPVRAQLAAIPDPAGTASKISVRNVIL